MKDFTSSTFPFLLLLKMDASKVFTLLRKRQMENDLAASSSSVKRIRIEIFLALPEHLTVEVPSILVVSPAHLPLVAGEEAPKKPFLC